jgi:hypothetical protein
MTAEDYLRMVAFELHDLPWRTRRDLFAELRGHLNELPANTDLRPRWERRRSTRPTCARPPASSGAAA